MNRSPNSAPMNSLTDLINQNQTQLKLSLNKGQHLPPPMSKYMQSWDQYCQFLPPNHCLEISDWNTGITFRSFVKETGSNHPVHWHSTAALHENDHQWYQLHCQHVLLALRSMKMTSRTIADYTVATFRSLVDPNGSVQWVKIMSKPIIDSNTLAISNFISWIHPLAPYAGQPLSARIVEPTAQVHMLYKRLQGRVWDYLPFTKSEKIVVQLYLQNFTKQQLLEELGISRRTLDKYNQTILSKCRELFVLNSFINAKEAIAHLGAMGVVKIK